MAKAKKITGLDCDDDASDSTAKVLRVRFDEVADFRRAALNSEDIKGVHAMRVATRRLRSALRDFAPFIKKPPFEEVGKDLKRIADALGQARDEDVAIAALEKLQAAAESAALKEGIGKLTEERRAARKQAQLDLMEALAVSAFEDLQKRFAAAIDEATQKNEQANSISFNEAGREAVSASLQEFCDLSVSLYEPFNIKKLHKLRIVAKRLRYAIELFTACWGEALAPFAEEIAEMQSLLGEVHDADVWLENLGARLRENNGGAAEKIGYQTAVWLLSKFAKERMKNYRAALKLWSEWKENDFVERLRMVIAKTSS